MRTKTPSSPLFLLYALVVGASALLSQSISEGKRPNKHPNFSDGFREFKQENWEEAADYMAAALDDWQEDGELTRVYGRWFEPYLPRYYLGAALLELGCYQAALDHLSETLLNHQEVKGAKKQRQQLESLKLESEELLSRGITADSHECNKWNNERDSEEGRRPQ